MDPRPEDEESADEGQVLTPDDLDIASNDSVAALDEGRYVIAPEGKNLNRDAVENTVKEPEPVESSQTQSEPTPSESGSELDGHAVKAWLEADVRDVSSRYGFRITSKNEDAVGHQQLFSDDVGTVFDGLLMWYSRQLDRETPVEDVLGILLMESKVSVRFPVRAFTTVMERHDLGPEDSISDLFDAMYDGEGVIFPPERSSVRYDD